LTSLLSLLLQIVEAILGSFQHGVLHAGNPMTWWV